MKKTEIALIGCGRIGFLLEKDPLRKKPCTHYGGAINAGLHITCACDTDPDRLAEFGRIARITEDRLSNDYNDLLEKIRPRCVIIATHTSTHVPIAMAAARSGADVIVLEKPIAPSLAEASQLLEVCRKNKTRLIVNHERRYDGRYRAVRRLIEKGSIGTLKSIRASILTGPYRGKSHPGDGGGSLLHDGTHLVDMVRFFSGEVITVRGRFDRDTRSEGYEDRAVAWLTTDRGIDIFLESGGSRTYFVFELEISGTDGKILIGNGYQSFFKSGKSLLYRGFRDLLERPFPGYTKTSCFTILYREVKTLLAGTNEVTSTGDDGYRALEIIHAIYLSSYKKIEITLPVDPAAIDISAIFALPRAMTEQENT